MVKVVVLALVAALNALVGPGAAGRSDVRPTPRTRALRRATRSPARTPSPAPTRRSGTSTARATPPSRASRPTSRSTSASAIDFKIETDASAYTIDIYRMGYYQGLGARKITSVTPSASLPQNQPNCITDVHDRARTTAATGRSRRRGTSRPRPSPASTSPTSSAATATPATSPSSSATTPAPPTSSSRPPTRRGRPTTPTAAPTSTAAAPHGRAYKVSYNRPVLTRGPRTRPRLLLRPPSTPWCASSSATATTSATSPASTPTAAATCSRNHKVFLSVGHDEYWSEAAARQRRSGARRGRATCSSSPATRSTGGPATSRSVDASHTAYRTLVSYKETWGNAKIDPDAGVDRHVARPALRLAAPTAAGSPENALDRHGRTMVNFSDLAMTRERGGGQAAAVAQHLARAA